MRNTFYVTLAAAAVAALGLVAGASASTVSIGLNFTGGNGGPFNLDATPPGLTAGVVAQSNWNDLTGSTDSGVLQDSTGTVTTAGATWSSADVWGTYGVSQGDSSLQLLNGYIDTHHQTNVAATVTVSSIPYASYEVIAYVNSDHLSTGANPSFGNIALSGASSGSGTYYYTTVGPVAYTSAQLVTGAEYLQTTVNADAGSSNPVADYAIFTGVTGSSFTLTNTAEGVAGSGNNVGLAGLQIVDTTAVPEPASLGLVVLGAIGMLLLKKRSRPVT